MANGIADYDLVGEGEPYEPLWIDENAEYDHRDIIRELAKQGRVTRRNQIDIGEIKVLVEPIRDIKVFMRVLLGIGALCAALLAIFALSSEAAAKQIEAPPPETFKPEAMPAPPMECRWVTFAFEQGSDQVTAWVCIPRYTE